MYIYMSNFKSRFSILQTLIKVKHEVKWMVKVLKA